jgi:signal transduction histidine kinase
MKAQDQNLERMQCFAEIGKISSGMLHDILNPISGLMLYMDFLKQSGGIVSKNSDMDDQIKSITESNEKLRDFIKIIQKNFNPTKTITEKESVNLNKVIEDTIKITYHKSIVNKVSITFIRSVVPSISAKTFNVYQVILNLITNAVDSFDSIPNRKTKNRINISVTSNDGFILFKISDNGCGIEKENINKIFNKDYTTKEKGIGIGLSTTRRIIEEELNGSIKFESQKNNGTTCTVKLKII